MLGHVRKRLLIEAAAELCGLIRFLGTAIGLDVEDEGGAEHAGQPAARMFADGMLRPTGCRGSVVTSASYGGTPGAEASLMAFLGSRSRLKAGAWLSHYELSIPGGEKQG